jgi:branched-chain amino acid transport system ATP-binding protein
MGGAMNQSPIISIRNLEKRFGGVTAVSDLELSIDEGAIHCLIGPNGAGKSTLFKLLVGIETPSSGSIHYRGTDITAWKPFQRARAGMAVKFQDLRIFPELTLQQNFFLPLSRRYDTAEIEPRVRELLAQVGLPNEPDIVAGNLSHGQQQWLALGLCVAARPNLVLLDEPTAGMGPVETLKTGEIVREMNTQGATVIVIEHDMAFVRDLDARTTVLHYGSVFAEGSFEEIEGNHAVRDIYLGKAA